MKGLRERAVPTAPPARKGPPAKTAPAAVQKALRLPTGNVRVAAFPGSGHAEVGRIIDQMGAEITYVDNMRRAHNVPFDRLLLLGGSDLMPWLYGEVKGNRTYPEKDRDLVEWILVRRAMAMGVPIFGICRGHQLINVAYGGTLHQDIQDDCNLYHPNRSHKVHAKAPLKRFMPSMTVNSYHHQCVNVVAPGFTVVAHTLDGIVEGIWKPGVLGVQWHPEMLVWQDKRWLNLFSWFLNGDLGPTK